MVTMLLSAAFSVLPSSSPIVLGNEEVDDCQEIFGEFLFGTCFLTVVNHESHFKAPAKEVEEIESKPAEPVFVGNHKLLDTAVDDKFQKGLQTLSVEVEA